MHCIYQNLDNIYNSDGKITFLSLCLLEISANEYYHTDTAATKEVHLLRNNFTHLHDDVVGTLA